MYQLNYDTPLDKYLKQLNIKLTFGLLGVFFFLSRQTILLFPVKKTLFFLAKNLHFSQQKPSLFITKK